MAEGTYEYECMRAELLGIEKPDYETFVKEKESRQQETAEVAEEEVDNENLKEAEAKGEQLKNAAGGLEELNNILSITQKKIDRFKVRCNSITSLLKMKVGSLASGETSNGQEAGKSDEEEAANSAEIDDSNNEEIASPENQRKSDLSKALDNHVDKLDAMLESADNAYHSMTQQNKQMKKFLK